MPFKRPLSSNDDSESNDERQDKTVLVHILQAKIHPETMSELTSLVENYQFERVNNRPSVVSDRNLELTADVEKADIIVTATNMRQRLERHIDWRIAVCGHTPLSIGQSTFFNIIHRKRSSSYHHHGFEIL
jgi:DNA polymerase mu